MSKQLGLFEEGGPKNTKVRVGVEKFDVVWEGVLENFDVLFPSAAGITTLRNMLLDLAVRGKLTAAQPGDIDANELISEIGSKKSQPQQDSQPNVPAIEVPFQVREHWAWCLLEHLIDPDFPISYGVLVPGPEVSGGVPFVRIQDLSVTAPAKYPAKRIAPETAAQYSRTTLRGGELLLGVVGSIGKVGVAPSSWAGAAIARAVCRIMPHPKLERRYVAWVLQSRLLQEYFAETTRTLAQPTLNVGMIRAAPIPLPPVAEQQRIVATLDRLMALCDELEARQTRKRETGTRLTKSALEALTTAEGPEELDTAWERVVENFDVLIDCTEKVNELKNITLQLATTGAFSRTGATDWKRRTVAEVADCRLGKMLDKVKNKGAMLPYLRNTNVHWFRVDLTSIKQMPFEQREHEEYELRSGDLLVCEGGHGIGRTAVWNGDVQPMMFQKALHRLRPRPEMDSWFLAYQMKVAADTGRLSTHFTGAGIPHLTGRRLAEMEVNVPPIAEQRVIVAKVQHIMKLCDDLEARLRLAEDRAARLAEAAVQQLVA